MSLQKGLMQILNSKPNKISFCMHRNLCKNAQYYVHILFSIMWGDELAFLTPP